VQRSEQKTWKTASIRFQARRSEDDIIYNLHGHPVGQLRDSHVYTLHGHYIGELDDGMIVDKSMNPGSAGSRGAGSRGSHFIRSVVHQNHPRTEKAVVPSAWSANFRRDLLIDPGKIELIS
jgi:hypothetical protein